MNAKDDPFSRKHLEEREGERKLKPQPLSPLQIELDVFLLPITLSNDSHFGVFRFEDLQSLEGLLVKGFFVYIRQGQTFFTDKLDYLPLALSNKFPPLKETLFVGYFVQVDLMNFCQMVQSILENVVLCGVGLILI